MRWSKYKPREGDYRTLERFCLFPKTINGVTYWLEKARIVQRYTLTGYDDYSWKDVAFQEGWRYKSKQ